MCIVEKDSEKRDSNESRKAPPKEKFDPNEQKSSKTDVFDLPSV